MTCSIVILIKCMIKIYRTKRGALRKLIKSSDISVEMILLTMFCENQEVKDRA